MKKQILLVKLACLLFLPFSLGGCWDKKDIEKRAYVIAIGLDKGEEDKNIKITYILANPEFGTQQQGGSTNEPAHEIITFETADLISPLNKANIVIAKQISYDLLRVLIVSEKLAKEKDFIRWMYDATKEREIRRDSFVIVTKEEASKYILNNNPKLENRAHKYFDLIIKRGIEIATIPKGDIHRYLRITEADADLFLAIYSTTEHESEEQTDEANKGDDILAGQLHTGGKTNTAQMIGSAVFKEGIMIGKLTGKETRISALLSNISEAPDMLSTFTDPFNEEFKITARITQIKKNEIEMTLKNGATHIDVNVPLKIDILTDHSMVNYASNKQKRDELKRHLEESFEKGMMEFIDRTQEEFKGEPFGWSLIARKKITTVPAYKKFNWMKSYPDMDVSVSVDITFGEFGRQSKLPDLKKVRD